MKLHNSGNGHGNGHYGSLRHQKDTTFTQSGAKDEEERTLSSKNRHGSQAKASQGDRPVTKGSEVVMEPNTATESSQGKIPAMSSSTTQDDAATANKDAATAGGGLGSMLTSVNVFRFIPTTLPAVDTIKKKIGTSIDRAEQLLMLSSSKLTSPSPTPALATQESSSTSSSDESTSKEADPQTATTAPTTTTSIASSATSSEKEDGNTTTSTMISTQQVSRSGDPRRHSMQPPSSSATPHAPRSPTMKTRELSIHRSASLPSTRGLRGQDLQGKGQRASTPTTTTSPMESTSSHRRDSKDKGRSHHPSREASHSQRHKEFRGSKKKKADIEYTGIWEVFQVPYCLTLPSETVHLGQKVPLKIRFGPFPWTTRPKGHLRSSSSSSSLSSLAYTDRDEHGRRAKHHHHRRRRRGTFSSTSDSDGRVHSHEYLDGPRFHHHHHQQLQRPPRFRVTRGTLKLVEHIVLRKIDHIEVPQKLKQQQRTTGRHYHPQQASEQVFLQPSESLSSAASLPGSSSSSRHRQYASLANVGGGTRSTATPTLPLVQVTPSPSSVGRFSIRRLVGRKNSNQDTHTSSSISHLSASSPSTSPRPSEYMERLHEDHQRSGSSSQHQPHHLAVRSPAAGVASAAVSLPSSPISAHFPAGSTTTTNHSGGGGAGFRLWPKSSSSAGKKQKRQSLDQPLGRHSMDNSELAIGGRNASADALHRSGSGGSGSTTAKTGTNSTSGSGHTTKPMTTKVISQVEARFKTEVMSLPLDQFLAKDKALFIGEEGSKKRKMRVLKKDENSAFVKGDTPEEDGQDSDQEENDHSQQQAFWETTVWFTIPDPSKVSPYTQTTNIVKSHTLQLILGFALEVPPALPRDSNDSDEGDEGDDDLPLPLPTPLQHLVAHPGAVITKPFRLELDLYITGPPAPST
ncbi:hypothetical protein BGZ73_000264 [Actinomortierella ambigua]|nr:hypothetical protein BGZ73_000264 [Actinomortierella ambigua]